MEVRGFYGIEQGAASRDSGARAILASGCRHCRDLRPPPSACHAISRKGGTHLFFPARHKFSTVPAAMNDVAAQRTLQHGWSRGEPLEGLITREWLVTNSLGGYASGTIGGACTRRFHGQLIAALPAPLGRLMMFNHIEEVIQGPGICYRLSGDEHGDAKEVAYPEAGFLQELVLEEGLPVWRFTKDGIRLEKRVLMPHLQNTTYIIYRLLEGPAGLTLRLRP